jgi:DNA replication protein DnaC
MGYQIFQGNAFVEAKICDCVKSCPECFGKARALVGEFSKPCKLPSPTAIVTMMNQATLPARYDRAILGRFANFSGNGAQVVKKLSDWAERYAKGTEKRGILLWGPVGVGKTFLLCALARGLVQAGISAKFVDFFDLLGQLRAAYANNMADESLLGPLRNVNVLFIDELGKGRNNDWELSVIDQLVMGRYNQNKIIVGSTNYNPAKKKRSDRQRQLDHGFESSSFLVDEFETLESRVGQRIYSRLIEICEIVEITGDDYRQALMAHSTKPTSLPMTDQEKFYGPKS